MSNQSGNLTALFGLTIMILHHYRISPAQSETAAVLGGIITILGIFISIGVVISLNK